MPKNLMPEEINSDHYPALLKLNEAVVEKTAPMNNAKLHEFVSGAAYARQLGGGAAMLLVLDQTADFYDSENLDFFAGRYEGFYYVDRIIVGEALRGHGAGRLLYDDLFGWVRRRGGGFIGCEVNTMPDNPGSHRFHQKMGFSPCGNGSWDSPDIGRKEVAYYEIKI